MGGKMDKPDYVDQDWTSLTEVKTAKWADMMEEIKEEGSTCHPGTSEPESRPSARPPAPDGIGFGKTPRHTGHNNRPRH